MLFAAVDAAELQRSLRIDVVSDASGAVAGRRACRRVTPSSRFPRMSSGLASYNNHHNVIIIIIVLCTYHCRHHYTIHLTFSHQLYNYYLISSSIITNCSPIRVLTLTRRASNRGYTAGCTASRSLADCCALVQFSLTHCDLSTQLQLAPLMPPQTREAAIFERGKAEAAGVHFLSVQEAPTEGVSIFFSYV